MKGKKKGGRGWVSRGEEGEGEGRKVKVMRREEREDERIKGKCKEKGEG